MEVCVDGLGDRLECLRCLDSMSDGRDPGRDPGRSQLPARNEHRVVPYLQECPEHTVISLPHKERLAPTSAARSKRFPALPGINLFSSNFNLRPYLNLH